MKISRLNQFIVVVFYLLMMLVPGALFVSLYSLLRQWFDFSFSFYEQKANLGIVIASFSFTMMGFLAAVLAIIFVAVNTSRFDKYKRDGFLGILLILFFFVILFHCITFFSSLLLLSDFKHVLPLIKFVVGMTVNNFVQVLIISIAIIRLVYKSVFLGGV